MFNPCLYIRKKGLGKRVPNKTNYNLTLRNVKLVEKEVYTDIDVKGMFITKENKESLEVSRNL